MTPKWKGKTVEQKALNEAEALANPISKIISQLQSSLTESTSKGLLTGCSVLLEVKLEQIELMESALFGDPVTTDEKDKKFFQLSLEEAFYLCYVLKCIKIVSEDASVKTDGELWHYMASQKSNFPLLCKAYCHLRMKNWVVKGRLYGVDFVAYRHRPKFIHSEYMVLVLSENNVNSNGRLRVWSDYECTLRLAAGVVKTLLVLHIDDKHDDGFFGPSCLKNYSVEERVVTRWNPQQSRENPKKLKKEIDHKSSTQKQK